MGQDNVLKVLKREKKWMTPQEIAKKIGINSGNVSVSLRRLFKGGEVLKKTAPNHWWGNIWRCK